MKINKLFTVGALLLSALAFTACSDDDDWSGPGEASEGAYLYSSATRFAKTSDQEQKITISIGRTDSTQAGTVSLTGDNSKFAVPASVNFQAGQAKQDIDIPFTIPAGETDTLNIAIADSAAASQYGFRKLTLVVSVDYNWESAGSGTFTDNTFFTNAQVTVEIQHAAGEKIYRIMAPYNTLSDQYFTSTENIQFTLNDDGTVGFDDGIYDIFGYGGYEMYFNSARYGSYCNVTNNDGVITWNFLLLSGTSLYTGGNFSFEWVDGYPLD